MSRGFILAVTLLLGALLLVLMGDARGGAILGALAFGWIRHVGQTFSNVRVDWNGVATLVACLALSATLGHHFCRWLWRGEGPWRPRWTFAGLASIVVMFAAGLAFAGAAHQVGWLVGRSLSRPIPDRAWQAAPVLALIDIAEAQEKFRERDPDLNGVFDYWTGELARLPYLNPHVARADDRLPELERTPAGGSWIRRLTFPAVNGPDPRRYAVCAYPAAAAADKRMFIISHDHRLWSKTYEGTPPSFFPRDPAREGWTPVN